MRMIWVEEDFDALSRLTDAGTRWREDQAAQSPGRLIRALRRGLKVSQVDLARRAGLPRSVVSRLEAGGDSQLSTLRRLLAALGSGLVILPCSAGLLARFRSEARHRRGSRLALERMRRVGGILAKATRSNDPGAP